MNRDAVFEIICSHAREVVPTLETHRFVQDDSLKALGANSIDRSEIVMMTLESLSVSIPLTVVARAENMGELATLLHERL
jgi:polyketide biosynthesis acyl carrier protein